MLEACCWPEALATSEKVADTQVRFLLEEIIARHNCPLHFRDSWSDSEVDVFSSSRLTRSYWRERDASLEEDDRPMVELRRREQGRAEKLMRLRVLE